MELPQSLLNIEFAPSDEPANLPQQPAEPRNKRLPALRIMTQKRNNKIATIIWAEAGLTDNEASELAKTLKQQLGVGGSSRGGEILLQGNVKDKALTLLNQLGHKARLT